MTQHSIETFRTPDDVCNDVIVIYLMTSLSETEEVRAPQCSIPSGATTVTSQGINEACRCSVDLMNGSKLGQRKIKQVKNACFDRKLHKSELDNRSISEFVVQIPTVRG